MKNKKNMFALAIVALILVLGVGYAVVSNVTLTINGSAGAKRQDLKVVFDGENSGTTTGDTGKVTAISNPDNTVAATFTVADLVLNETVEMEFEIQNKETDVNASLAVPTVTNTKSDFFDVAVEYKGAAKADTGSYAAWSGAQTLNAEAKATVKVKVKLKKTPVKSDDSETTITVSFVASPAE